jgi:hypothetical protein
MVDGPYETTGDADASVASLDGVSFAKRAGRYVVSATLSGHIEAHVREVAKCLEAGA